MLYRWANAQNISHPGLALTPIPLKDLLAVAKHQNTKFQPGDILFVRTGFGQAYDALSLEEQKTWSETSDPPCIGVLQSEELLRWLWDNKFAAVVGDAPSFEVWPCQDKRYWLHEWGLAGWGMPIGEFFDLEKLAVECEKAGRWSFFFSSMPLNVSWNTCVGHNSDANQCRFLAELQVHRTVLRFSKEEYRILSFFPSFFLIFLRVMSGLSKATCLKDATEYILDVKQSQTCDTAIKGARVIKRETGGAQALLLPASYTDLFSSAFYSYFADNLRYYAFC